MSNMVPHLLGIDGRVELVCQTVNAVGERDLEAVGVADGVQTTTAQTQNAERHENFLPSSYPVLNATALSTKKPLPRYEQHCGKKSTPSKKC